MEISKLTNGGASFSTTNNRILRQVSGGWIPVTTCGFFYGAHGWAQLEFQYDDTGYYKYAFTDALNNGRLVRNFNV